MKIYRLNFISTSTSGYYVYQKGSLYPIKFNNNVYDKNNLYYFNSYRTSGNYRMSPMNISQTSSSQSYKIATEPINGYVYSYGFPRIVYTDDNTSISAATILEQSILSGKYKLKNTFNSVNYKLTEGTIDVIFSINNVKYCAICISASKKEWYGQHNSLVAETTDVSYHRGRYINVYKEPNEPLETPIGYETLCSDYNIIKEEYVNSIWDFGVEGQIVPTLFKEWVEENFDIVYPYEYKIKNTNGSITYDTLTEAPPMKKALLDVIGNTKILKLTGINDIEYTLQWESTDEKRVFKGLALSTNSKVINIPIGVETDISLSSSTSLYEVYNIERPPVTTFEIQLFKNSAEENRVDKVDYLELVGSLNGVLRDSTSITDLYIEIEQETFPEFNYVYITNFNRYYYVNDIESIRYKIWGISLSVDVLMSYKEQILNLNAFIDRNQNDYNADIVDKNRAVKLGYDVVVDNVSNELFTVTNGTYVLNGLSLNITYPESETETTEINDTNIDENANKEV